MFLFSCQVVIDSMDHDVPGSSDRRISKARILECAAISSPRRSSWPRDQIHVSYIGRRILYHRAAWEAHISPEYFPGAPGHNYNESLFWEDSSWVNFADS